MAKTPILADIYFHVERRRRPPSTTDIFGSRIQQDLNRLAEEF
jgi:hypothetical protein